MPLHTIMNKLFEKNPELKNVVNESSGKFILMGKVLPPTVIEPRTTVIKKEQNDNLHENKQDNNNTNLDLKSCSSQKSEITHMVADEDKNENNE